ncbi:MAG TPA: DNA topoisomerase 3 [Clostridiaceae bacterium]|nr:DNA topoisomerase 3 [Clostridiaceae bacterium]
MILIVAEKPSVALTLARVLGATKKKDGFYEGEGLLVSWCIGHLVSFMDADEYDACYQTWRYDDLPIVPSPWKLTVSKGKEVQYRVLESLLHRIDVNEVCCATDAGREGELIFRFVYEKAGGKQPVTRLWLRSMEEKAIQKGFSSRQPAREYDNLYHAALCRAKADWLVGINASRLFSILYRTTLPVGRVQSPTLALVVAREASIENFKRTPYFRLRLRLDGFEALSSRFAARSEAEACMRFLQDKEVVVQDINTEDKRVQPPLLYDLTTLQRDANRLFGFTASETLELAQRLYEKKLITYPRTDSNYLTTDMADTVNDTIHTLQHALHMTLPYQPKTERLLRNAKVRDHHALIPALSVTESVFQDLPDNEQTIIECIARRLLQSTGTAHGYQLRTVTLTSRDQVFTAKGKVIVDLGWKALEKENDSDQGEADEEKVQSLPTLQVGQHLFIESLAVTAHETTPPKPYTDDTLLAAMEKAGKDELNEDLEPERQGLGTPATRAGIIEKLIASKLLVREKRTLRPTPKGTNLIAILPDALKSPSLTAEWENRLNRMASGNESADAFLTDIETSLQTLVSTYQAIKTSETNRFNPPKEVVGQCPRCSMTIHESKKNFYCSNRGCDFVMWKNDLFFTQKKATLTKDVAATLLAGETVWFKSLHSAKTKKTYQGGISMNDTGEKHVRYQLHVTKEANE